MAKIEITKNELQDLYEKKWMTTYEVADFYSCCQATIWKRMKQYKIKCLPNGRRSFNITKKELDDVYMKKGLSSRKIAKLYGCAYSTIDSKIRKFGFPIKTLAGAHVIYQRNDFNGSDLDKAYMIGFAIGDLRVRKVYPNSETIHIDCASTKQAQIDLIERLFKPYGRVWIGKPTKRGVRQIECSVNLSFFAGFTDAEGCISINKDKAYYSLGNYNKKILMQIRDYLNKNQIICSKLQESKIKGRMCFGKYFHRKDYWQFAIHRKESLFLLFEAIRSYLKHEDKRIALKKAEENINLRNKLYGNINWTYGKKILSFNGVALC